MCTDTVRTFLYLQDGLYVVSKPPELVDILQLWLITEYGDGKAGKNKYTLYWRLAGAWHHLQRSNSQPFLPLKQR